MQTVCTPGERLADGTIRLLRCDWLLSDASDAALSRDAAGSVTMRRRQELPDEAFFAPEEAAALLRRGDRSVFALSHGWQVAAHPDPHGFTLARLRRALHAEAAADKGAALFWDFASLPQKPRTEKDVETFKAALNVMISMYASVTGTCVLQQKAIPPRPPEYDGMVTILGLSPPADESALRAELSAHGEVLHYQLNLPDALDYTQNVTVHLRYASHEDAVAAIEAHRNAGRAALLTYNERAYDGDGGRGWCITEQCACLCVAAHLQHASHPHQRFEVAQAARPKVFDISGDANVPHPASEPPARVLDHGMKALHGAHFVGKGDREVVQAMLGDLEWTMKTAIDEALDLQSGGDLTIRREPTTVSVGDGSGWLPRWRGWPWPAARPVTGEARQAPAPPDSPVPAVPVPVPPPPLGDEGALGRASSGASVAVDFWTRGSTRRLTILAEQRESKRVAEAGLLRPAASGSSVRI